MRRTSRFNRPYPDNSTKRVLLLGDALDEVSYIDGGNAFDNTYLDDIIDGLNAFAVIYPDEVDGGDALSSFN
jgi:hypothetical protein